MRIRLIEKKNFSSQFEEAGEGKTELASAELNREDKLRDSMKRKGKANAEPVSIE
jgi:hypothetical protein